MRLGLNALSFILVGVIVAFVFFAKIFFVYKFGHPSGDDIQLHLPIIQGWLDFENPLLNEKYFINGYPRPPAMHLTVALVAMLPFVSLVAAVNFFEIIIFSAALITTFYLVYKKTDVFTASLSVMILAESPAFWDRGAQVIPQAFDVMLFPIAVYLFLEGRRLYIPICIYLVYNHWAYAILPIGSLFVFSLIYKKEKLKDFGIIALASIPLAAVMLLNASAMFAESSRMNEVQELAVLNEPFFVVKYLGYLLFFLVFMSAARFRYIKLHEFEKLVLLWILALLPMSILFPDRFIGYVAQPLAVIGGIVLADLIKNGKARACILFAVFLFALLSQYYFHVALFSPRGIWMPLDTLSPFVISLP